MTREYWTYIALLLTRLVPKLEQSKRTRPLAACVFLSLRLLFTSNHGIDYIGQLGLSLPRGRDSTTCGIWVFGKYMKNENILACFLKYELSVRQGIVDYHPCPHCHYSVTTLFACLVAICQSSKLIRNWSHRPDVAPLWTCRVLWDVSGYWVEPYTVKPIHCAYAWWRHDIETLSASLALCESASCRCIPLIKGE